MPPKEDIQKMLEMQSKAYNDATSLLFSSLSNRLDEQNKHIIELQHSLEFSQEEIKDLKTKNELLKSDLSDKLKKMDYLENLCLKLQDRLDHQEDYSRRKNLKIEGIEEIPKENQEKLELKVKTLLENKLNLEDLKIDVIHRLPRPNIPSAANAPRPIIAQLTNYRDKEITMRSTWKLKNTGIYINDDICENTAKVRKDLLPKLKQAKAEGKIAYFNKNKLIIKTRTNSSINIQQNINDDSGTPPVSTLIEKFSPAVNRLPSVMQFNDDNTGSQASPRLSNQMQEKTTPPRPRVTKLQSQSSTH